MSRWGLSWRKANFRRNHRLLVLEEEEEAEEDSTKGSSDEEENKKKDLAWTTGQTAPVDNLFFLTFRSNAGFLSFSFSLSLCRPFSSPDYARLLYLVSLALRSATLSRFESCRLEQFRRSCDRIRETRRLFCERKSIIRGRKWYERHILREIIQWTMILIEM